MRKFLPRASGRYTLLHGRQIIWCFVIFCESLLIKNRPNYLVYIYLLCALPQEF